MSEIIEEFPEVPIHAADDIVLGQEAQACRRSLVFPGEIAGGVPLRPRALINAPEIFIDLIKGPCAGNRPWFGMRPCGGGSGLGDIRSRLCGIRNRPGGTRNRLSGTLG